MDGEIYAKINRKFNERRTQNEDIAEERKQTVYGRIPRIKEIDSCAASLALHLLEEVAAGKNAEAAAEEFTNALAELHGEKRSLLAQNGYRPDFLDVPYSCKICRDTGLDGDKRCRCYNKLLSEELMKESNLSESMKKQTFSSFSLDFYRKTKKGAEKFSPYENMLNILSECKKFADEFDKTHENLLLYGATGLGKSFLSSAVANRVIERGFSVFYQSAGDVFSRLEDIKFGRLKSETSLLNTLLETELLIIDDLGTEFINQYSEAEFFKIINSRLLASKSAIINTNLSLKDIGKTYSDRILSRILGGYSSLRLFGDDIRTLNI